MKILISESQYKKLIQEEEEENIFRVPKIEFFHKDIWEAWKILQKILERRGNPPYSIGGDLNLVGTPIESLGNLQSVGGYLDLYNTPIESLGNLTSVGSVLDLRETPLSKMYTEEQIREMVNVGGNIYL